MRANRWALPIAGLMLLAAVPVAMGASEVQADKENVVAGKLEGKWEADAELNKRLGGGGAGEGGRIAEVTFKSDVSVAAKVPAKYDSFLKGKQVYMAGTMTLRGVQHPFLLIENAGGPYILYFQERGGDPMGDGESFHLSLAPAKETQNDILFIGGDFNGEPFSAFRRVKM